MTAWTNFLDEIRDAEKSLGNPREIWYRGHSDDSWDLSPSLFRQSEWARKEKELFVEFSKTASRLFDKRGNDWEILFDMQHYWIPTRLLDWTTVMGVAIAFILHGDYSDKKDSAVFVLDPLKLNILSGRNEIIGIPEDKKLEYKSVYWDHLPAKIDRPLAIRPNQQSARIQAQKGVFTVHGTPDFGLEISAKDCFRKIILPVAAKAEARDFLKWANLDEYTVYPDIVGMSRHITRKIL